MQRLTIAIDPELKKRFGPEICWTWRLLLSGMGFSWAEVPMNGSECDVVYAIGPRPVADCRLYVCANIRAWAQKSSRRFNTVGHSDGCSYPIYDGEDQPTKLFDVVDGRLMCVRDIVFDVFWLVTGQEERYWPKDRYGHFDLSATAFYRERALRLAVASSIGTELQKSLIKLGCPAPAPRWPYGKRAAACFSHDVDYPEVVRWLEPLRMVQRQGLKGLSAVPAVLTGSRHHWHFMSWMQLEKGLNIRSAFFFVARQGSLLEYAAGTPDPFYDIQSDRYRNLVNYLADEGFEIGLHSSYRACESREKFAGEKRVLEEVSGREIWGNRHHYWHLDPEDPESTLKLHEEIGLKYDTSLIHERYVGWRRGLSWPFFPFHQKEERELKTLQIPTAWMDDQLFGYRQDNPGDALAILRALADNAAEQSGCLLTDVHNYVFDDVLFPGWAKAYRWLCEYLIARSDFWIDTPGQIARHWIQRYCSITEASHGLTGTLGYS